LASLTCGYGVSDLKSFVWSRGFPKTGILGIRVSPDQGRKSRPCSRRERRAANRPGRDQPKDPTDSHIALGDSPWDKLGSPGTAAVPQIAAEYLPLRFELWESIGQSSPNRPATSLLPHDVTAWREKTVSPPIFFYSLHQCAGLTIVFSGVRPRFDTLRSFQSALAGVGHGWRGLLQ